MGDLENDLDLIFQGHLIKIGYNFSNMGVKPSVTIGSLQESDYCESDADLEIDLDLIFKVI